MGGRKYKDNVVRLGNKAGVFDITEVSLPLLVLHDIAGAEPDFPVFSFFYEVLSRKKTEILQYCGGMRLVKDTPGLESAFSDDNVKTILVEKSSCVAKDDVMRVCRRHAQGKTVFFEVEKDG